MTEYSRTFRIVTFNIILYEITNKLVQKKGGKKVNIRYSLAHAHKHSKPNLLFRLSLQAYRYCMLSLNDSQSPFHVSDTRKH